MSSTRKTLPTLSREGFARGIIFLRESYPESYANQRWSSQTSEVWFENLSDLDERSFFEACQYWGRNEEKFPTIAQLRHISMSDSRACGPEEAWGEVIRQVRTVGWCGKPQFSNSLILSAIEAIGSWRDICATELDQMTALRAHFYRTYNSLKTREDFSKEIGMLQYKNKRSIENHSRVEVRDDRHN